jgi:hypothetical protein
VVNVVVMARVPRNDRALSAADPAIATRRWLLVVAAMLAPIALGALATIVLYATRAHPVVARPVAVVASDVKGLDGSVLVLQPRTTQPVRVPLGMTVEVVLHPGYGQDIVSVNDNILAATANPPCHVTSLCGFPGAHIWTFRAVHGGVGYLKIIFGFTVCQSNGLCTITPYVYKPIAVYTRPQAG